MRILLVVLVYVATTDALPLDVSAVTQAVPLPGALSNLPVNALTPDLITAVQQGLNLNSLMGGGQASPEIAVLLGSIIAKVVGPMAEPLTKFLTSTTGMLILIIVPLLPILLPSLVPVINNLVPVLTPLLPVLIPILIPLLPTLIPLVAPLAPILVPVIIKLVPILLPIIVPLLPVIILLLPVLIPLLPTLVSLLLPLLGGAL